MSLDFSKLHILVVEDVLPMRSLLAQLLKVLGVGRVSVAKDGREGYEKYRREKPDIIITDWCMPALDGVELTLKVRRDKESPNRTVPIILMTGFIDKSRIGAGRDGGVTEVIIKPFSARDIAKRIEHVTQNPRDFVVTNNYVGPSRRRKKPNISKEENRRAVDTPNIIHDRGMLEAKVGTGEVSVLAIERSQQVMDDNDFDFEPMAREYLDQLFKEVSKIKETSNYSAISMDNLLYPIMQIKANARIFKYNLLGDLAAIMLRFFDRVNVMDAFIVQIVGAFHSTSNHILSKKQKGDQGEIGEVLSKELDGACDRYLQNQKALFQRELKKVSTVSK